MPRPALPEKHANRAIVNFDETTLPPVKYQILNCQGRDILIGRCKIPTPTASGHAFILRRFDTGAISLTTMFRAAFPEASDQEEKKETAYVKESYDLSGNNGTTRDTTIVRLAGTWISPDVAMILAPQYHLSNIVRVIVAATPDPTANYRRSGKEKDSPVTPAGSKASISTVSPTLAAPSAAKRRKESPAPSKEPEPEASPAPSRRSTRVKSKSPAPSSALTPLSPASTKKPAKTSKVTKTSKTPTRKTASLAQGATDETLVDEDETAEALGKEMFKEDIAEQKKLIANLKAQRNAVAMDIVEDAGAMVKRAREEDGSEFPKQLNIREPEVGERQIATNSRVSRFRLEPRHKSVAWGMLAFAAGITAMSFVPNFL